MPTAAVPIVWTPTAGPPPPTAAPQAVSSTGIHADFTGQFLPKVLRVGEKLDVRFGIADKSSQTINGVRIFSTGPWDKYTIVNVMPSGSANGGLLGTDFDSNVTIGPGETIYIDIIAYPNEPGNHAFSFIPHELSGTPLVDDSGSNQVIGGSVAVVQ